MRFSKTMDPDTLSRDAEMVQELQRKSLTIDSDKNKESFEAAAQWFLQKHGADWSSFAKNDSDKKEGGKGV